jgi:hypothetical protein
MKQLTTYSISDDVRVQAKCIVMCLSYYRWGLDW